MVFLFINFLMGKWTLFSLQMVIGALTIFWSSFLWKFPLKCYRSPWYDTELVMTGEDSFYFKRNQRMPTFPVDVTGTQVAENGGYVTFNFFLNMYRSSCCCGRLQIFLHSPREMQ